MKRAAETSEIGQEIESRRGHRHHRPRDEVQREGATGHGKNSIRKLGKLLDRFFI
jgi:hypothetical protein